MYISEKLQNCFNIILERYDKFIINQPAEDVESYLKNNFNCTNIPADVLNFLTLADGINIGFATIYSVSKQNKEVPALTFDVYSAEDMNINFCEGFGVNNQEEKYFFFGEDGKMGKFAFLKNVPNSNSVYHFKANTDFEIIEYETFADLLMELIEKNLQ